MTADAVEAVQKHPLAVRTSQKDDLVQVVDDLPVPFLTRDQLGFCMMLFADVDDDRSHLFAAEGRAHKFIDERKRACIIALCIFQPDRAHDAAACGPVAAAQSLFAHRTRCLPGSCQVSPVVIDIVRKDKPVER